MRKLFVLSSLVLVASMAISGFDLLYLLPKLVGNFHLMPVYLFCGCVGFMGMVLGLGGMVVSLGCESPQQGWFRLKSNFWSRLVDINPVSSQPVNFCKVSFWTGFYILFTLLIIACAVFVLIVAAYKVIDAILHASRPIHELTGLASAFAGFNYTFLFITIALVIVSGVGYLLIRRFRKSALYRVWCPLAELKD